MAITMERLVELGGKVWERGEMKRVYFNYDELAGFYGFKSNRFGATVDGEKVSNSRAAALHRNFTEGKFWFDLNTGEFDFRGIKEEWAEKVIDRIREAVDNLAAEELATETENGETVETATEEAPVVNEVRTAVGPGIPAQAIRINRRPGYCRRCRQLVPAGKGHLYYIDPDEAYEDSGWIVEHIGDCPHN